MLLGAAGMVAVLAISVIGWALGIQGGRDGYSVLGDLSSGGLTETPTVGIQGRLPEIIRESSGVAVNSEDSRLFWTHNDGGDGRLFLVSRDGQLAGSFRVTGVDVDDIEDIEVSPCLDGESGSCLYLADTGDNGRNRDTYAIHVAPEPRVQGQPPSVLTELPFRSLSFRFADGSRDVEALAVSPSGEILVITKGQEGAADVFRIDAAPGDETVEARPVGRLPIDVEEKENRITAAAFHDSGETLVVRSDEVLYLFAASDLETTTVRCVLTGAGQGEGVDFLTEDLFLVTQEGVPAPIEVVRCP